MDTFIKIHGAYLDYHYFDDYYSYARHHRTDRLNNFNNLQFWCGRSQSHPSRTSNIGLAILCTGPIVMPPWVVVRGTSRQEFDLKKPCNWKSFCEYLEERGGY